MKKLILLTLGIVAMVITSCTRDDLRNTPGGDNALSIRVNVQGQSNGSTRATVDPLTQEENIHTLYLLFYTPSSDGSGTFEGSIRINGPILMNQNIGLDMTGTGLNATNPYKILAVANLDQYGPYMGVSITEWLDNLNGKDENYALKQLYAHIAADEKIEMDKIIMTGETEKPSGGLATIELTLLRGVVRFDVVNSARATYDLESVSIWNAFPETSLFGSGLTDYSKTRIQRFYGVDNDNDVANGNGISSSGDPNGDYYGDIFGGLYSLPNQVIDPGVKDEKTTCLIVGLKERGNPAASVTYHRVNINAEQSMQNLKRNNVYRLTIRSVGGEGADSEMEAYTGGKNNIKYQINYWDLDDDGLIQQNGNIILGIPTKLIKLGAEAEERSYDIFAFGGQPGEQISISTSFNEDAGNYIKVTQNGNTINVNAKELSTDTQRTGSITITYGGLTATIGIIQSGTANQFLRVSSSTGSGIPAYPGFAGAPMDGTLTVEASGPWTATIYHVSNDKYFSFSALGDQGTFNSSNLTENLSIYTFAENSTTSSRNAFVLISLNADPENYNSALVLTQRALGSIAVSPNVNLIEWDGLGKLSTTGGGISDTQFKLNVITTTDPMNNLEEWEPVLSDDTHFEIVGWNYDATDPALNFVTVKAKGETTDSSRSTTLRVQLKASPSTGVNITLTQTGYTMGISPNTFTTISNKGGETAPITVTSNGTTLTWSAEVTSTTIANGTLEGGHTAIIVDATSGTEITPGTKYPLTNKFRVKYPMLYYGNHQKGKVTANITVKLWSGNNEVGSQTFPVEQNELEPRPVNLYNVHSGYSHLFNSNHNYSRAFPTALGNTQMFGANGTVVVKDKGGNGIVLPTSTSTNLPTTSSASWATWMHANQYSEYGTGTTGRNAYTVIENWRKNNDGIMFIVHDEVTNRTTNGTLPESTVYQLGWRRNEVSVNTASKTPPSVGASSPKILKYIYQDGPFGPVTGLTASNFINDGASSRWILPAGGSAVAILGTTDNASLVIDPANRLILLGESQFFSGGGESYITAPPGNDAKSRMFGNILSFAVLTAQYGSNFSDLFVE